MSKKISEMVTATTLAETDMFEIAQVAPGAASGYASFKTTLNAIAIKILTGISFNAFGNKTVVNAVMGTVLTDTLEAGETSLTFSDNAITTSSTLDIYTSSYGVSPSSVSVSTGTITMTFVAQSADLDVKVRVS